jgi:hypothetical protein
MAVMTRALRPVWCLWSSSCEEIMAAAQQQAAQEPGAATGAMRWS